MYQIFLYTVSNLVSGQLPPRMIAPTLLPPRKIAPRIITPWMIAPGLLLPDNYPKDNCPLTISPWKLPPRKTAFRMICRLYNSPSDKWPRGKLPPLQENCPEDKLHPIYFSPKIGKRSTLIDSCFLLFSFFVV